jgi:hypothetical protein
MKIEKSVQPATELTDEQLADINARTISRREFIEGVLYGGDNKTTWSASIVRLTVINDDNSTEIKFVWQLVYTVNDKMVGSISKSLLLQEGKYSKEGELVEADGSAQKWAKENMLNGMNEKECFEKFAIEANKHGLKFRFKRYPYARKNGGIGIGFVVCVDFGS